MPTIIDADIVLPFLEVGYREQQADWAETDPNKVSYIKNKPVIPDAQVNSDWSENDTNNKSHILNRTHYTYNVVPIIESRSITFSVDGDTTKSIISNLTLSEGYYWIRIRGQEGIYKCTKEGTVYTIHIEHNPDNITFTYNEGEENTTVINTTTLTAHYTYVSISSLNVKQLDECYIPDSITRNRDLATVATSGSYTDLSDTPNIPDIADTQIAIHNEDSNAHNGVDGRVGTIEEVIPSQTYDLGNELADKTFVNSSIATNTATFKGTFNLVNDLNLSTSSTQAQIGTALGNAISQEDNNDYSFVLIPTADSTPTEIDHVDRYKYNGTNWVYEYTLNNSGFTAAQWAAINSGITDVLVAQITNNANNKADKVTGATNGHVAGLDANGNLTDSGIASSNVMQKVGGATNGNVATLNASGEVIDSGKALSALANDADVVHKTGAETVTGVKNFSNGLQVGGQSIVWDSTNQCLKVVFN